MSRTNQANDKSANFQSSKVTEEYHSQEELDGRVEIVNTDKVAIVDADIFVYWALAATDEGDSEEEALENLKGIVLSFERNLNAKNYLYFLSGTGNFRYLIGDERRYKGNRTGDKHVHYDYIKKAFVSELKAFKMDFIEADDALSIFHNDRTILCTIDKDLKQCPGEHYHLKNKESFIVTEKEAHKHLWIQALTGDTTDCILGVKGVGPAKAEKILSDVEPERYPNIVLEEYIRNYGVTNGADLFAENYHLVRMKTSRGQYIKEKYANIFDLIDYIYLT